jgi:peptidoglycan/LPS O-acetylase OafA/YrhL
MTETRPVLRFSRVASLDGWRAISIGMVLFAHGENSIGFPQSLDWIARLFGYGSLGVQFFFVLSGFLIALLMLREFDLTGRVNIKHFYARRALRILPAYVTFLAVLGALQASGKIAIPELPWIGNLTFTANYTGGPWVTCHLWSLSVEEQFYVLWPFLFVTLGLAAKMKNAIAVLAVPIVVAPIVRTLDYKHLCPDNLDWLVRHGSLLSCMDSLAFGCASAIVFCYRPELVKNLLTNRPWVAECAAAALLLVPHILTQLLLLGCITVPFRGSLQSLGFCILLLQSVVLPDVWFYKWLNWKWISAIGVWSYSIYLWHILFCAKPETYGVGEPWWLIFPWWMLPAFACGIASYYGVESYFNQFRSRFR